MSEIRLATGPKPFVFVLMPFDKSFDDVYQLGIRDACVAAGAYCERVDEQMFHGSILDRVYNQISKADLLIADMTERNANVFYEVGYAHALGKRVVLLTQNAADIPFDLMHYPHIVYGKSVAGLREQLAKRVAWAVANPDRPLTEAMPTIQIFLGGRRIEANAELRMVKESTQHRITLGIHNAGDHVVSGNDHRVALIAPKAFLAVLGSHTAIPLPDDKVLHPFPPTGEIFPTSWESSTIVVDVDTPEYNELGKSGVPAAFRLVTRTGIEEFPVLLRD